MPVQRSSRGCGASACSIELEPDDIGPTAHAEQRRPDAQQPGSASSRLRRTRPHQPFKRAVVGYRHIDTAAAYSNEREVGEGIRRADLDRSEVFIETKVWISDYGYDKTLHAFDKSAAKLGVDSIDLLILHQPLPTAFDLSIEAYTALETLLADGKVRAIGVSNFKPGASGATASARPGRARREPDRGAPVLPTEAVDFMSRAAS